MYEVENPERFGLHSETRKRIREVFEGRTCTTCGSRAERLFGEQFYCLGHYPETRKRACSPRVYRCAVAVEE